jgi:nucleotide-binding universal stress UspA family protein
MKEYRKILIAMNGSKEVLVEGLKLTGSEQIHATVVKVTPPFEGDLSLVGVGDVRKVLDGISERTVNEIKNIAESMGVEVKVRVEAGEIDKKIVEVAEEEKSDLIIMGAGSQSSVKKFLLGNVLDNVTYQAPCPVLVVKSEKQEPNSNVCYLNVDCTNRERKELSALRPRYF